ncbi:hypothetical protein [Thalassorhabdomicrobium marinisediminis]|uniref:Uncharacterized protein n=1 Tax=Thalassorhabdomicrobium marinisediminis TaxID=2170577 RepID=A0A2T7G0S6_9RHOB|nr:hypothetical protein [Thalassorhabdomicrobium marinisediminis]PVA08011.1 hypothetical protein DC363_00480 [Thalassorhabdomicrobium marinisediminis]
MTRAILTLLFTVTFVVSPYFSNPFSGFEADQLPIPQIDPPIQPAGYAFGIWGLIYAWLLVSALFGIWSRRFDAGWDVMRAPLIVSLALGTPWLWVANQSAIAASVLIFFMLAPAIVALLRAPDYDGWLTRAPVSVYAGWLTAASFVSLGSTAAGYGLLFDATGWAYAGIVLTLVVALAVQWHVPQAPGYGLTIIWALIAIIVTNGVNGITALCVAGIVLVGALVAKQVLDQRR